jgi:hypothetical protein
VIPFDFSTDQILAWELDRIHEALIHQEINLTDHAINAAGDEDIPLVDVLEVILVGVASSKDLPGNAQARLPGINFEHRIQDGRNVRVKVAWLDGYWVITVHTIPEGTT